jgi:hypothetical protein
MNDPQFFNIIFINKIKTISQKLILFQHRLGNLCHQIPWHTQVTILPVRRFIRIKEMQPEIKCSLKLAVLRVL